MTKEVLIHLKGMQTTDAPHGSDEPLELITVGEYYYRNNTHYLLYEEQMEGQDQSRSYGSAKKRTGTDQYGL